MAYFIYNNLANAALASQSGWNSILGRPKLPQDTTKYAWSIFVGLDGRAAVDAMSFAVSIPSTTGFLGPATTLDPVNWPIPLVPAALT